MTIAVSPAVPELRTLAEIESAALKLDAVERAELVRCLAVSLDQSGEADGEMTEEDRRWLVEIERRVQEVRDGKAVLRDGPTVMQELLAKFS